MLKLINEFSFPFKPFELFLVIGGIDNLSQQIVT